MEAVGMKRRIFLNATGVALAAPRIAAAQSPAVKPTRVIVPLPAGSSTDFLARVLMTHLAGFTNQNYVIENKAGANSVIGTQEVVRAAPDGNTLLCAALSALAVNVALVKNLPYDPLKDLTPIGGVSLTNHVLMVKAGSPILTLTDFIARAKKNPGRISIGHSTTTVQVQIATLEKLAGIQLLGVPYKGTPATITDVIGGVLDATLLDHGNALAQVRGGAMRALGVTSLRRNPVSPDWPAISETLSGFDFSSWIAVVGPAGMPQEMVSRLSDAIQRALKQKELIERFASTGTIPLMMGSDELRTFMQTEVGKWVRLAREANIQPE